jgi:LytS/YehU family sensor histidine kinase
MYKDTPQADEMLTEFSEFLRYTLKNKDDIYVNLEDEIEIISKYLYIEKIRFQEKLKYVIDIPENTRHIKVLSFLLQPFVENAIKHGLKANNDSLIIEIICKSEENKLFVTIKNSGEWDNKNLTKGIGIENVKNRLKTAYSGKHILEIKEENGWVIIKIQIDLING